MENSIVTYNSNGDLEISVRYSNETVWLSQAQMSELFQKERSVITKHINNIFKEDELEKDSNVQNLHITNSDKPVKFYSLDVIISVGYRVKSKRGTQFRIWANKVLKEYLIKGYAIKDNIKLEQYEDLKSTIKLMSSILNKKELEQNEATGLLRVVSDYTYALDTLDRYDYQSLEVEDITNNELFRATYETAMGAIEELRDKFGGSKLFGNEKDNSFKGSIGAIYQTFNGEDLYKSVEEKAAILLYLVTKNHSFSDGNKRIAAFLFLWFMERNGILYNPDGTKRIGNNTLVALTLMIAESKTEEMDTMIKVIVNLINRNN